MRIKWLNIFLVVFFLLNVLPVYSQKEEGEEDLPLKVAIFGRNKTGNKQYEKYVDQFKNELSASLSGDFTIIDKDEVISTFEKVRKEEKDFKNMDISSFVLTFMELNNKLKNESDSSDDEKTIEQKASALRISQMLGADFLIMADVEEIVSNNIKREVYGNKINDLHLTADVSVKILDGSRGCSVLGKTIRAEKILRSDEKTSYTKEDTIQNLPLLMREGGKEVAKYFRDNIDKAREFKIDIAKAVNFTVQSNVEKAVIELDGVVIGSVPGSFDVSPGLHRIRITKEGYKSFERDINIFPDFQLKVSIEMTEGGLVRHRQEKDIEMEEKERESAIEREKIKTEAEADYLKKIGDAEVEKAKKGKD